MVAEIKATAFVQAFRTGRTCPYLMLCEDDTGSEHEVVVKLRTGNESTGAGLIRELIASLLASDLDLPAPEPYLVDVAPDFHKGICNFSISP